MTHLKTWLAAALMLLVAAGAKAQGYISEIPLDFTTGKLVNPNPVNLAPKWESNAAPNITIESIYGNFITGGSDGYEKTSNDHLALFGGTGYGNLFCITIEDGYKIVGYRIACSIADEENPVAFSQGNNTYFDIGEQEAEEEFELSETNSFTFRLVGANAWVYTRLVLYVESENIAPVNYTIRGADNEVIYQKTIFEEAGKTISALPESLLRKYTSYEYGDPIVVKAGEENFFEAKATFNLPFTTGDDKRYFVNFGGYSFLLHAIDETRFSAKEDCLLTDSMSLAFQWTLEGDPYRGIGLKNVENERYATGTVMSGTSYVVDYCDLTEEYAGWDIEPADEENTFRLFMNGTDYLCIWNYRFFLSNDPDYYGGMRGRISLVPVPDYKPVEVTYIVVDVNGDEVVRESEYRLDGDRITDLPEEMKRGFCKYELSAPFTAKQGEKNELTAIVEYELPFQTFEENKRAWYCLVVADTVVVGALPEGSTVYAYGYSSNDGRPAEEYKEEQYCWWTFMGSPYEGFALRSADEGLYFSANASSYVMLTDRPDRWYVGEGPDGTITLSHSENTCHPFYEESIGQLYNWNYESFNTPFKLEKVAEEKVGVASPTVGKTGAGVCYDLQGRRVEAPRTGIYILNGKKYLRK